MNKNAAACLIFIFLPLTLISVHAQKVNNNKGKNLSLEKIQGTKPRNVVFILTDDHRYDFMGFTGKLPWLKTPNMDRLYNGGVLNWISPYDYLCLKKKDYVLSQCATIKQPLRRTLVQKEFFQQA